MTRTARTVEVEGRAVLLPGGECIQAFGEEHHQPELETTCGPVCDEECRVAVKVALLRDPVTGTDVHLAIGGRPVGKLDSLDSRRMLPIVAALHDKHGLVAGCNGTIIGGYVKHIVGDNRGKAHERGARRIDYQVELDLADFDDLDRWVAGDIAAAETFDPRVPPVVPGQEQPSEPSAKPAKKSGCLGAALALGGLLALVVGLLRAA